MPYPSEETARRNRWQDDYDAETRQHVWQAAWTTSDTVAEYADMSDVPADVKAEFEDWK